MIVFQLPESFFASFDNMIAFEEKMINSWPKTCTYDAHDIDSGSINFLCLHHTHKRLFYILESI